MIKQMDLVALTRDLPAQGLVAGDVGWVVAVHDPGAGYDVQFVALTGETVAVVSVPADGVRSVRNREIPHARLVEAATPRTNQMPGWFAADISRNASWLPDVVKQAGLNEAYRRVWAWLPADIQIIVTQLTIPTWLLALAPTAASSQDEIYKQLRFMADLAGSPPANPLAQRAEQLLIFGGAAQLPTPGDKTTGQSLGAEGCTAAMSKYVLAQLTLEFAAELAGLNPELANSQSSVEMESLFQQAAAAGLVQMRSVPFAQLQPGDFLPGSLTIAKKPGGTHVFGWTRVPSGWNWVASDMMAVGNTGLPQFGDRMILAQEYVTGDPTVPGELDHNQHGPINSSNVIMVNGQPDLSDPRTNVYAVAGADFVLVNLVGAATV